MKREEIGGGKSVERVMSDEEVTDELAAKQEVTEVELRQLAQSRARQIREFLVGENQTDQGEAEDQGHQPSQERAQNRRPSVDEGDAGGDQTKENTQTRPDDQTQENEVSQDGPMGEDRVFLLEVELGGSTGGQVRSQLNLSGA